MSFLKTIQASSAGDKELLTLYKQSGDLEILGKLYQPHMELVYGVCLKYLKDNETAKDAVMAIFEELVLKLRKHDIDHFKAWLHTLAKNHCLMQLRASKHIKINEFDPDHMQITETVHLNGIMEKEEHLEQLNDCLKTLSPEQKNVVELFYLQNKCYKEIESITGVEWNKVRSHIQNGRRNLKICMEQKIQNAANE
ncbi:MAG: sigma-70 family RNA polymerase sigma factor [Bacteroidetes bacterium]|nr:sigma-70 family RNA polymerase sigma factor [Bacteroidota bacterium]